MPVSKKTSKMMEEGSWIRRMFEAGLELRKRYGPENVFDLSLGNPEVEPPAKFVLELRRLASEPPKGMHRYMQNVGHLSAREAVAAHLSKTSKVKISADDVVMTCGAAGALNVTLKSMCDAGDEVIIVAPYFVEYIYYIDTHGMKLVIAETDENFMPDLGELSRKITPKTRALIINSPNNPTGAVYGDKKIRGISELLLKKGREYGTEITLILDDVYGKLVFDGAATPCIFNCYDNAVIVSSFSKTLAVPGERIGYAAVSPKCSEHKEVMEAMAFTNRTLGYVNAPSIMQLVIAKAIESHVNTGHYKKKRDRLYSALVDAGYEVVKPMGAFYIFPKTPIADDIAFTKRLLEEHRVLAVPGRGFGRNGYMRLAYCVGDEVIEGAIKGLKEAIKRV